MRYTVRIPSFAKDEQEQEWILFLAFLHKLAAAYSSKDIFKLYHSDVRTILGLNMDNPTTHVKDRPWADRVEVCDLADDAAGYRLLYPRTGNADGIWTEVEISDTRCVLIWVYLMGCFTNNLVEPPYHNSRMGLDRQWKALLRGTIEQI